jgi:small nuclear ribonucleoprotein
MRDYKRVINMVMPLALLEKTIDKRVSLLLKDGRVLEGKLTGFDEYMNMVLEETVERTVTQEERRLGSVVLRGNNVVSISVI